MKKRIFLCVFAIAILIMYLINTWAVSTSSSSTINKRKTIILDAGHGGEDGGAVGIDGIFEKDLNLKLVKMTRKMLEENGYKVIMTREEDQWVGDVKGSTIGARKREDINNRVNIVNESGADILISIHMNKFEQEQYWGWQTFYNKNNKEGKIIAQNIQNGIKDIVELPNERTAHEIENIKLIDKTNIPAVIVECGFISNREEIKRLQDEKYQEKIAKGIVAGINKYY